MNRLLLTLTLALNLTNGVLAAHLWALPVLGMACTSGLGDCSCFESVCKTCAGVCCYETTCKVGVAWDATGADLGDYCPALGTNSAGAIDVPFIRIVDDIAPYALFSKKLGDIAGATCLAAHAADASQTTLAAWFVCGTRSWQVKLTTVYTSSGTAVATETFQMGADFDGECCGYQGDANGATVLLDVQVADNHCCRCATDCVKTADETVSTCNEDTGANDCLGDQQPTGGCTNTCNDCDPPLATSYHCTITDSLGGVCFDDVLTLYAPPCGYGNNGVDSTVFMGYTGPAWTMDNTASGCFCDPTRTLSTNPCDPTGTFTDDGLIPCTVLIEEIP